MFPGGSVSPGSRRSNVWAIDSEDKTKSRFFQDIKNSSFSSRISLFLAGFSWKFVTWFLAGSSSFSWYCCDRKPRAAYARRTKLRTMAAIEIIRCNLSSLTLVILFKRSQPSRDEHGSGLDRTGSGLKPILAGSGLDRIAIFLKIGGSGLDRTEKNFVGLMWLF